ncbi:MAG: hypothetical protein IT267_09495 [Saprospiraceae bacterium]|nr:hypothetical protein [Saprospiraceae bacterium]
MSSIKNFFNNLFFKTKTEAIELKEKAQKLSVEAKEEFKESTSELQEEAAEAIQKAKAFSQSAIQEIKETASELKEDAEEGLAKMKEFGSHLVNEVKEIKNEVIEEAKETLEEIKQSDLVKKINEVKESFGNKDQDSRSNSDSNVVKDGIVDIDKPDADDNNSNKPN